MVYRILMEKFSGMELSKRFNTSTKEPRREIPNFETLTDSINVRVLDHSILTLKIQQNKLEKQSFHLKEQDRMLFEKCMDALKKNNREEATIWATEIAEVRKSIKFLFNAQLDICQVIERFETEKQTGILVSDRKHMLRKLRIVSQEFSDVFPDISSELKTVCEVMESKLFVIAI
jgi:division protein CdvB (Snf7/Vps24/ESCRT-III family)